MPRVSFQRPRERNSLANHTQQKQAYATASKLRQENLAAQLKAGHEKHLEVLRARGEPGTLDDFPRLNFDANITAVFTQEVSLSMRTIRIPVDCRPAEVPQYITSPMYMSPQSFASSHSNPLSNLTITLMTEASDDTKVESFSNNHELKLAQYILESKFNGHKGPPSTFGRLGDFLVAQTVLDAYSRDGKKLKALYVSISDGTQIHTVVVTGIAADDTTTLQQFEAIIATLN